MHLLPVSLLAILVGTLLLAKTRKEELGKLFAVISWFFLVVGFVLFIGVICRTVNRCHSEGSSCRQEMMMRECCPAMHGCPAMQGCPASLCSGDSDKKGECLKNDSTTKSCSKHP
jgi:hypothetical protein